MLLLWVGCQTKQPAASTPPPWPAPLLPLHQQDQPAVTVGQIDGQLQQNPAYVPRPAGVPDHLILAYIASGRDFDPPRPDAEPADAGPDGYLLRVVVLDAQDNTVPLTGDVTIYLFSGDPRNCDPNAAARQSWQIPRRSLKSYWTRTSLLDCYVFRLSWQERDPGPGKFFFVVSTQVLFKNQPIQLCGTVAFDDTLPRSIHTSDHKSSLPNPNVSKNGVQP